MSECKVLSPVKQNKRVIPGEPRVRSCSDAVAHSKRAAREGDPGARTKRNDLGIGSALNIVGSHRMNTWAPFPSLRSAGDDTHIVVASAGGTPALQSVGDFQ